MERFLIWGSDYREGYCVIQAPEGIQKAYQLNRGISRMPNWPEDVVCRMSSEFPKDIMLSDNLFGTELAVISSKAKLLFDKAGVSNTEYLPVKIINHKARVAAEGYYILNPLSLIECIDIKKSKVEWNAIKTDLIDGCEQLVLEAQKVPVECKLFRPKHWPTLILIPSLLAEQFLSSGISGLSFREPSKYTGIG